MPKWAYKRYFKTNVQKDRKMKQINKVILIIMIIGIAACGPHKTEQFVNIAANETAFLVPLEGSTNSSQKKFMSVDFLNQAKIATKRISLPLRRKETGYLWSSYKYIPTMKVIKVNRAPITREWTGNETTGSNSTKDSLWVESKDSIEFGVGVNITALIKEENAATFLYTYAGTSLSHILNNNIRGKVNAILSRGFAAIDLEKGRSSKNKIFDRVIQETTAEYKQFGITITNIGLVEGMIYKDKKIQEAINEKFVAEMDIQTQVQKNLAQEKINTRNVGIAKAEKDAALSFKKAAKARSEMVDLEIGKMNAEARLTMATKWDGKLPTNILPSGSSLLMNFGK